MVVHVAPCTDFGIDDDESDRRPQRRRYEEPLNVKVRKQLLSLAESVRPVSEGGTMACADSATAIETGGR